MLEDKRNGGDGPADYNLNGIAALDMYSECSDCSDRGYPGRNSWSEPGTADSVSFNGYPINEYRPRRPRLITTWILRGHVAAAPRLRHGPFVDGSRQSRGRDVDISWR